MNVIKGYLLGRCCRPEYWITVVVLTGLNVVQNLIPSHNALLWLHAVAWFLLASRRCRDIGWSPWLGLLPIPVGMAIVIAMLAAASQLERAAELIMFNIAPVLILVLWCGFWVVLGVWKSKPLDAPAAQTQAEVFG